MSQLSAADLTENVKAQRIALQEEEAALEQEIEAKSSRRKEIRELLKKLPRLPTTRTRRTRAEIEAARAAVAAEAAATPEVAAAE